MLLMGISNLMYLLCQVYSTHYTDDSLHIYIYYMYSETHNWKPKKHLFDELRSGSLAQNSSAAKVMQ